MVLRAVDDPTNEMRVVAALRSPLLGCGDDDLFRFKVECRGLWNYLANQPDTVAPGDPVAIGLSYLKRLHRERQWRSPSELLDLIARDRRAFELGFADGRARDVWRRIRFIVDQARAWSAATGGGLRQYLQWVDLQTAEGARVAEAVLPETDDDAVRIMTIHAAKGLEFPITVVSGMSTGPNHQRAAAEAVFPPVGGNVGYRFGASVMTEDFENWKPIDEQMGYDERIRLLYVACTRVRDHLVVSVHRKSRKSVAKPSNRTNAELLFDGMGELEHSLPTVDEQARAHRPRIAPPPLPRLLDFAEWETQRQRALDGATRPTAVAATALTAGGPPNQEPEPDDATEVEAGLQKRPRDLDLPPWLKGRYGTAVGRAVHGVLQTVDLATGHGLDAAAAAQCMAEAIPDRLDVVVRLARKALDSPSVRDAAQRPHWREVYASTPVAGRLLEGYVDLLYRGAEGLVVIDHKTSASADPADLDSRVAGYRLQGAAYAVAVGAATGEPVVRVTFVFLTPAGPIERHLDDLEAAKADVLELVGKGAEVLTS
jgi:ATP-dependent exoDNAse (exonuclease V) beta subunit